jgi:type II secretory ATPase GspE/PulE/Tfp pilus assembly ATPase PilB-like protein
MLNSLNTEDRKIITIEDPVEYQFAGISQISVTSQTTTELNFANKLRAVLRLDPDIVMVGEIRDGDTAKTALQAALTGHLVLSTFHASSAAAALARIIDVINANPLFVSAIRLIMAQRLIRKLDDKTKEAYKPDEATKKRLQAIIDGFPKGMDKPDLDEISLYRPGKSTENPYGYEGQVAIREQFTMSDEIRELLVTQGLHLSAQSIEKAAVSSGMRTLLQDGIAKACQGVTTLDEVFRVVG